MWFASVFFLLWQGRKKERSTELTVYPFICRILILRTSWEAKQEHTKLQYNTALVKLQPVKDEFT